MNLFQGVSVFVFQFIQSNLDLSSVKVISEYTIIVAVIAVLAHLIAYFFPYNI